MEFQVFFIIHRLSAFLQQLPNPGRANVAEFMCIIIIAFIMYARLSSSVA